MTDTPSSDRAAVAAEPNLPERLELHLDAILSWAVAGYGDYRDAGMQEPASVLAATNDYRSESDAVARFINDACMLTPVGTATTRELFTTWSSWAIRDGAESLSERAFGKELDRLGYPATRTNKGAVRKGLSVYAQDENSGGGDAW